MATRMQFEATVSRKPAEPWSYVMLSEAVSQSLSSRGLVSVEGEVQGHPFLVVAWPDGQGGHWLKFAPGTVKEGPAKIELSQTKTWPEPEVPADLQESLLASPAAMDTWNSINTATRVDWIYWLDTSKKAETRTKRIAAACDMLAKGKKKVCCFDRSGIYSKQITCPISEEA